MTGRSPQTQALTRSYRWVDTSTRLGLVVQNIDYRGLGVAVVVPDMSGAEFDRGWDRVPRRERLAVRAAVPVVALGLRLFATRADIATYLALDDLRTPEDMEAWDGLDDIRELVVDDRDRRAVEMIAEVHQRRQADPIRVGVVYGAGHVPAISRGLHALGYRAGRGEWLTVFGWEAPTP